MKKSVLVILAILYLSTVTEFRQVFRIPVFIHHFLEHTSTNNTIGLSDFLYQHYAKGLHVDSDQAKDMELPFKDYHHSNFQSIVSIELHFNSSLLSLSPKPILRLNLSNDSKPEQTFLAQIWQPPQIS